VYKCHEKHLGTDHSRHFKITPVFFARHLKSHGGAQFLFIFPFSDLRFHSVLERELDFFQLPDFHLVVERMPATFQLSGAALLIALCLAIPAGIVSAVRRNSVLDYISTVVALLGQSMPTFWLGIMLILLFSVQLQWLPSSGRGDLRHLVLPAVTLGLFTTARITRLTRSGMLEVLDSEYVKLARLKGVVESRVVWVHALKNALIPVVTFAGIYFAILVTTAIVVETVFAWPGLGRLAYDGITSRDFPVIQAVVLTTAALVAAVNLCVDCLYAVIDARIPYAR
jgi:peptide/nickel transport system permease protein